MYILSGNIITELNAIFAVFAWKRWSDMLEEGLTMKALYDFDRIHKYRLMAHNPQGLKRLGQLLANTKKEHISLNAMRYISIFMSIIKSPASRKNHSNTLYHIFGYFKRVLSATEKSKIQEAIEFYREGTYPLIVPLSFLSLYTEKYKLPYLQDQIYLDPYPQKLKLMNAI